MIDHRCARQERCARAERIEVPAECPCACHNGLHYACTELGGCGHLHKAGSALVGALIEQVGGLCPSCELVVADAISNLPHDYVSLRIAQYRGLSPAMGEVVSLSKDPPVPISLTFATLADQIEITTTTFAEPVAEKLGIDWDQAVTPQIVSRHGATPRYRGPVVLDKAAKLLTDTIYTLVSLPTWEYRLWGEEGWDLVEVDGASAALMLLALHQATRATLGLTRAAATMQAECPYCEAQSLVKQAGNDLIQCQLCARWFSESEYKQWSIFVISTSPKPPKKSRRIVRQEIEEIRTSIEGAVGRPYRVAE